MEKLISFLTDCLTASWTVFVESAPYMLFGFFIAGLLSVFLKPEKVARYFGGRGVRPVVLAALAVNEWGNRFANSGWMSDRH